MVWRVMSFFPMQANVFEELATPVFSNTRLNPIQLRRL